MFVRHSGRLCLMNYILRISRACSFVLPHRRTSTPTQRTARTSSSMPCFGIPRAGEWVRFGRPGCDLNRPTWSPVKASSALVFPQLAQLRLSDNDFSGSRNRHRHHLSATLLDGRLETAGPGCYDAFANARAASFPMLVMSRIRHAAIVR